jgi:hypothetical protein
MASLKPLADNYRVLAEAHDTIAENARTAADLSKAAAIAGLPSDLKDELVDGLGNATSDLARLQVLIAMYKALKAKVAADEAKLKAAGGTGWVGTGTGAGHLALIQTLMDDLFRIYANELLREVYRNIANGMDPQ